MREYVMVIDILPFTVDSVPTKIQGPLFLGGRNLFFIVGLF